MRLHYTLPTLLLLALPATPAFHQRVRGGHLNNKAIEIYNPDATEADLSLYKIEQYNNGASTPTSSFALTGKLAPGAVHVMAHSTLAAVLGARQPDRRFHLQRRRRHHPDPLGHRGRPPRRSATNPGRLLGHGRGRHKDHTLRRKSTVKRGDTATTAAFDPALQWDSYAVDDFSDLGQYNGQAVPPTGAGGVRRDGNRHRRYPGSVAPRRWRARASRWRPW